MEFLFGNEERFIEFMAGLNEKDKVAIFGHDDTDGIVSVLLASAVLSSSVNSG